MPRLFQRLSWLNFLHCCPPPSSSSSEASLCSLPLKPKQGLRSVVVPSRLSSVQAGYAIPQQRTRALNVMAFPPLSSVRRRRPRAEEGGTLQIDVCQMQREGGRGESRRRFYHRLLLLLRLRSTTRRKCLGKRRRRRSELLTTEWRRMRKTRTFANKAAGNAEKAEIYFKLLRK